VRQSQTVSAKACICHRKEDKEEIAGKVNSKQRIISRRIAMKKIKNLVIFILMVTMMSTILVGCATLAEETKTATEEKKMETEIDESSESAADPLAEVIDTDMSCLEGLKVGWAQRTTSIAWEVAQLESFTAAAEKYGVDLICTDADNDQSKQISDVEDMCVQGIDILIYPPVEYESGAAGLEIAAKYDVPVIVLGNDCKKTDDQYIAAALLDFELDGSVCGDWIVENLESAKIVEIQGQLGTDTALKRTKGFGKAIGKGGDAYEIVVQQTGNFMMDDAQKAMENIIQSYKGQFDTVFCHNDEMALGAIAALKAAGLEDITVLGIDGQKAAVQKIIDGEITAIATCSTQNGELAFSMIAAYLNGEEIVKQSSIPSEIIDLNNAEEAMTNGMAF